MAPPIPARKPSTAYTDEIARLTGYFSKTHSNEFIGPVAGEIIALFQETVVQREDERYKASKSFQEALQSPNAPERKEACSKDIHSHHITKHNTLLPVFVPVATKVTPTSCCFRRHDNGTTGEHSCKPD